MSDSEGAAGPPHPSFGGKSIESVQQQQQQNMLAGERTPYKSWRKKYRKMRARFDAAFEDNRVGFRQEHKLESTAKRLREELDELLEILLDLNTSPAIPPPLRYDIRTPAQLAKSPQIDANITPEASNNLMHEYTNAVKSNRIPPLDLVLMRDNIQSTLALQHTTHLNSLESRIPHPIARDPSAPPPTDATGDPHQPTFGYLTTDEESSYLQRLDARLGDHLALDKESQRPPSPHQAELTPRELERHMELLNPLSQHNWLKVHTKTFAQGVETDDAESLASHEGGGGGGAKPTSGRGKGKGKNLAKQVGDRAVERAGYEGASPGGATSGFEEDEFGTGGFVEEFPGATPGSGRGRKKDGDGAYKGKGGGRGGGAGKRKRKTDDGGAGGKKMRMSEGVAE